MNKLLTFTFVLLLISCKVIHHDIPGTYELKNFPKSTLIIQDDGTFIFTQNYPSPYLHPFLHPDEYYFRTLGKWHAVSRSIKLIGTSDSLAYETVNILSSELSSNNKSNFKFSDEFGDTVPIHGVQYSDSTWISVLHHAMEDYDENLIERDTLQFHFFGYEPWTFIQAERVNKNYRIELLPTFRPNEIDSLTLRLRKSAIGTKKFKFVKNKSR